MPHASRARNKGRSACHLHYMVYEFMEVYAATPGRKRRRIADRKVWLVSASGTVIIASAVFESLGVISDWTTSILIRGGATVQSLLKYPSKKGWSEWKYLGLPLLLYVTLSGLYLFAIPSGESPDEGGHVQCIEQVARERRLPVMEPLPVGRSWSRTVALSGVLCYHMPLYYMVSGSIQIMTHGLTGAPLHYEFPPTNPTGPRPAMFLHDSKTSFWRLTEPATMIVLRFFSIILGGALVVTTYAIGLVLFSGNRSTSSVGAVVLAGWPQFLFMSRAINNDALAIPLSAVVLLLLLQAGRPERFVPASIVAAVATLTKLTAAFTALVVLVVWCLEFWRWSEKRQHYIKAGFTSLALLAATVGLIGLHPLLSEHVHYTRSITASIAERALEPSYWLEVAKITFHSGWAVFGMMNVPAPDWQAVLWWFLVGGSIIVGGAKMVKVNSRSACGRMQLFTITMWAMVVVGAYVRINMNRFQPQFRYLFALLPILATLAAAGLVQLSRQTRWGRYVGLPVLTGMLLLANLWIITRLLPSAYAY